MRRSQSLFIICIHRNDSCIPCTDSANNGSTRRIRIYRVLCVSFHLFTDSFWLIKPREPGGGQRTFPYEIDNTTSNTVTQCLALCALYGYSAAAVEFSIQCFCGERACGLFTVFLISATGDPDMLVTKGSTQVSETDCTMPCSGDPIHLCGGADRSESQIER